VPHREINLLLEILDQAFDRRAWHGTTLAGSLRGVSPRAALWRPSAGRHNIWELVLHTAYWKYAVRRRLRGEKRGSFARPGSNWLALPTPAGKAAWTRDVALLKAEHQLLRGAIARFPVTRLTRRLPRSEWTARELIHGVAAHDLYHAGQIQLLKRLKHTTRRG
jgi:hypothetical protein